MIIDYLKRCKEGTITCKECSEDNKFPYEFCCLKECREHEFCRECDAFCNFSKNNDFIDIKDIFNIESLSVNKGDVVIVKLKDNSIQSQSLLAKYAEVIKKAFPNNEILFLTNNIDIETISIDVLKKLIENKEE